MAPKQRRRGWGFDTRNIDKKVRPQDDFYRYANGSWLKKNSIPADESRWGSFVTLRYQTEHQLKKLVDGLPTTGSKIGSPEQQIRDLYHSAIDMRWRNARGTKPIERELATIRALRTLDELIIYVARSHRTDGSALFSISIDQDLKNSTRYLLELCQGGLGLPERDYYLLHKREQVRVRTAYVRYVEKLMRLSGMSAPEAMKTRKAVMRIETLLAKASMNKVDVQDVDKIYHKTTIKHLMRIMPNIAWQRYLVEYGAGEVSEVNLAQPKFFEKLSKLLSTIPLDEWKRYLAWHLASDYAPLLSEPFVHASFDFWGKTISGSKKLKPLWRRALSTTSSILDEPIGKLYVKRYFPPEAKRAMNALVDDLFKAYEMRMKKLTWIGPKTKRRAIKKLRTMERKIGYPSRWRSFRKLVIKTDDYVGNCVRAAEFEHHRDLRRLTKPVDRNEWITAPQIVNAYAHLNLNDITFPAAILQPPFFDLSADAAVNYAAIGSCIGHEMTHGFDDRGSKFDEKGNHHTWWEARDRKRFEHKSHILVKQFNRYEAADGIMVHGKLTLGENIADLGGLSIAYDAFVRHLEKTGRKNINGLTPEQRFFLGFAQQEQELARKEFMKMAALIDPHSPAETRVNGPLSNFPPFYATYNVKKGDGLYREPKDRAKIW